MSLTREGLNKISKLARIKILSEEEAARLQKDLNSIINVINQLQEVDTDGIEPLVNVTDTKLPMREDEVTDGNIVKEVLSNAPSAEYDCFTVPKVIE